MVGRKVGHYEITARLGEGGMGEVYKARDTRLDRTVAIKVLRAEIAGDGDLRARFEREARAIASLDHPHICGIFDVGDQGGVHYLVMPHLEGQTLAARLEKGPLPLDQAVRIATEIADALDKAHRHGIVHRDLKPANVMLTRAGSKLLDFGLAKLRPPVTPVSMSGMSRLATSAPDTAHGMLLGTVPYMAPEQVEGREADARSDIWALGAVIYEMVTGARPFPGDTPASVIGSILKDDPPPMSSRQPLAPPLLDQVVRRCLAKEPDDRWQSARDLRTALELGASPSPASQPAGVSRARLAAAVVVLLAGGAALGWFAAATRQPLRTSNPLSLEIGPPPGGRFDLGVTSGGAAISPDRSAVAFVATVDGVSRLWIRPLDSIVSRELPDTDGAALPFWSPDGRSLGYFANRHLRRIEALGGASTMLASVPEARGGAWVGADTIVFAGSVGPLQKVGASGGTPSSLTTLAADEISHRWPRLLPDGRTLFFFVQGERPGVYLTALDRPDRKERVVDASLDAAYVPPLGDSPGYVVMVQGDTLVAQPFDIDAMRITGAPIPIPGAGLALGATGPNRSHLSVANDGAIVYAAGSNRYQMAWFGADGAALGSVGVPDRYVALRLSPGGTEALAFVDDAVGNRDIWRVDLKSGTRNRTTSGNAGNYGIWSPDGERIAITGLTRQTLFTKDTRRAAPDLTLHRSSYPIYPTDWSRDGKHVLFTQADKQGYDVWVLQADAGKATALLHSPATEWLAVFSPDGRFVAFTSNESGRDEVYVQSFSSEAQRQLVSTGGGSYPRWSAKGNELFYRSQDGRLVSVPIRFDGSAVRLGAPRPVMALIEPPTLQLSPYDIAPDGRILALVPVSGAPAQASLAVLMNWQAALRR
jgi:serine/threonine-protein kinase